MPVQVELSDLDALFTRGMKNTMRQFGQECRKQMSEDVWAWPNITKRRNGSIVGTPRDVIDTGELLDSQTNPVVQGENGYIEWTANHASAVFLGVTRRNGSSSPARNVPQRVANDFDFAQKFLEGCEML